MNTYRLGVLLLLLVTINVNAQYGGCDSFSKLSEKFKKTKTYVVLTGDSDFDSNLEKGLETYWTITDYEFINSSEIESKISNKNNSFILPLTMSGYDNYPILGVLNGGQDISKYSYNSLLAYNIIDFYGNEKRLVDASYRAKHLVKMLHDYIILKMEGKISNVCATVRSSTVKNYNKKSKLIKNKTLLIEENQLKKVKESDWIKRYSGKYKICSRAKIIEAIDNNMEEFCYLLPIFAYHKDIFVIDAKDGSVIYNSYSTRGTSFDKSDIKDLEKIFK